MEVIMQWLDEIDDLVSMIAARSESLRRLLRLVAASLVAALALTLGVAATLLQPAVAPVMAGLLGLAFLYQRQQDRVPARL
ncbi:MAG: hypothetical protein HKN35_09030 [Woeseia sp.]|nr:hypothetical protein [Woeseia sp.]MBT8095474.1 hypothetical protein [Woeseia sp.]NNE61025.1 hypothetical protein [Woeseia sp.]